MSQINEQDQECFVPAYWEQIAYRTNSKDSQLPFLNINQLLQQAKQLHNIIKPKTIVPRTCFLQLPITKLPTYLQQPCLEEQLQQTINTTFSPIQNPQHLSFQQYFNAYELLYNKIKMYNRPNFELSQLTSRFKPISLLSDFHTKMFKQLKHNEFLKSSVHVTINDQFDSDFQNGNLGLVYKRQDTNDREYFLLLENDINSHGYTSWFFFKVKSCGKGLASFHIVNLSKSQYLYKIGFKISIFSVKKFNSKVTRWFKGGKNIRTYTTNFQKKNGGQKFNCLYFQYQFQQDQTEVYFAMSRPYTYSSLTKDIQQFQSKIQTRQLLQCQIINSIYSICCNIIPILILSNKNEQSQKKQFITIQETKILKDKKILLFMARQHPGQVVGSHFMKKIMQIFTSELQEIKQLISKFTIIFIPMVNPDGVIHGSSRCNLAGLDLNRQWMKQCIKEVTPETYYLRKFIWNLQQNVGIQYLIDFHGHSKKMNSFFFANKSGDKFPCEYLPYIICKLNKRFDVFSSTFSTTPDKKNTLRNQLFQNGMKNCVTVENSYFGYYQQRNPKLFQDVDYYQMSEAMVKSLYYLLTQEQSVVQNFAKNIGFSKDQLCNEIRNCRQLIIKKTNRSVEQNNIQSDSDPEGDIMKPQQMIKIYECERIIPHKKLSGMRKKKKYSNLKDLKSMPSKDDQLRTSQPIKIVKDFQGISSKIHKSQKKLQPNNITINNQKATTQQRFRQQPPPRPVIPVIKRLSTKKETVIRQTVLSMQEGQPQQLKQAKEENKKGRLLGSPIYKYQNIDTFMGTSKNKRRIQSRLRTEVEVDNVKNSNQIPGNYRKMKQQSIQIFLNQTLSIGKVNKNGVQRTQVNLGFQQLGRRKNSLKSEKYLDRSRRFQGYNQYQTTGLQIDISPKKETIAQQRQQRKKHISYNYKKELTRRKKILNKQVTNSIKYKKFQKFTQNNSKQMMHKKEDVKPQCNSVFYYFPIL